MQPDPRVALRRMPVFVRWMLSGLALTVLSQPTRRAAGEPPPPETSVAQGSTTSLFADDFQDGDFTTPPWTVSTTTAGPWSVITDPADATNRVLSQGATGVNNESYAVSGDATWTDYSVQARLKQLDVEPYPGLLARFQDTNNYYMCRINKISEARMELSKKVNGAATVLASYSFTSTANTWHSLRITVQGSTIRCSLDGDPRFEATDTALTAGRIGFRTNWGKSVFDDVAVTALPPTPPAAPTGLAASDITDSSITLTWNAVADGAVYRLYRSRNATGVFQPVYTGTDPAHRDTGLTKGTTYYYKVTCEIGGVESASSDAVSARTFIPFPGIPTGLALTKIDSHSAELRWTPAPDATSYRLYRSSQPGGPYALVHRVNENLYISTSGIDCEAAPQTSYYYVVSALNERGESAPSAELEVTTPSRDTDLVHNGGFWCPENGAAVIQGHGGSVLQVGDTYYWYGEDKSHNGASFRSVTIYSSKDLAHWSFVTHALTIDSHPELADAKIERPKVLYNATTGKYVLWGHKEVAANYNEAKVAVAVSDTPDGHFTYLGSFRPDPDKDGVGDESRDFTVFQDDDGTAYLIASTRGNLDLAVYRLTPDYLDVEERIATLYPNQRREAPAVVKKDGVYFLLTSGQSGWAPNQGRYSTATSMAGPWTPTPLPIFGDPWSLYTQPAFIMTVKGTAQTTHIYAGDRWHPNKLGASEYVWLPLELDSVNRTVKMEYVPRFKLDVTTGELLVPSVRLVSGGAVVTTSNSTSAHPAAHAIDGSYATYWEAGNRNTPFSVNVDLGEARVLGRIDLSWRGIGGSEAYYQYKIYGSTDNTTFVQLADRSTSTDLGFTSDTVLDTAAYRYLGIAVSNYINFNNGNPPGYNPGLYEIEVFGKADQTIDFPEIPTRIWGVGGDFTASARTTWGLPVSFAASGSCTVTDDGQVHITAVGPCTITASQMGDGYFERAADVARTFAVIYNFSGFFEPIDNPGTGSVPVFNTVNAGRAVPVKFSLGGDQGLGIFVTAYPRVEPVGCPTTGIVDENEATTAGTTSGLHYHASSDQYIYVWKTDHEWTGSCRKLIVRLVDGTDHVAYFSFIE